MPSKLDEKGEVKSLKTREIHVFARSGKDPMTGQELGHHTDVKFEWDEDLQKRLEVNPKEIFSCVEVVTDPSVHYLYQRTILTNLQLPASNAINWLEMGHSAPELDVSGYQKEFDAQINAKQVVINQDNPELTQLLKTQAIALEGLQAQVAEMKADKDQKELPADKAGGKKQ